MSDIMERLRERAATLGWLYRAVNSTTAVPPEIALLGEAAAEIERLRRERDEAQARADNHWQTLRSIREMAREGDCDRIIQWLTDAGSGYVETNEATLKATIDRATAAEAQVAMLREALVEYDGRARDLRLDDASRRGYMFAATLIRRALTQPKESGR